MPQYTTATPTLSENALGAIGPDTLIKRGETNEVEVDEFVEALKTDEFFSEIGSDQFMPLCCVDGRHRLDGTCRLGANAAGGVFTLLAADMLTTQRFRQDAANTLDYAANLFDHLDKSGYAGQYGDHRSDVTHGEGTSGCGAVDQMAMAMAFITAHGDKLRGVAESLGIQVDEEDHKLVTGMAGKLAIQHGLQFGDGKDMLGVLEAVAGKDSAEVLTGTHNEVAVIINEREGTTLNRAKIKAQYGQRLQAFNYDRWAMQKAVQVISQNREIEEVRKKMLAADYYNLAVACLLGAPDLRVVTRGQFALSARAR